MADSYDDKIETMLVTRQRMAEQRKARRRKELTKQFTVVGGALLVLIILIALIAKGCSGEKNTSEKKTKVPQTTAAVTTAVAEEEETTAQEEETEEEATTSATSDLAGKTMYTTDVLNFRTEPNTGALLIVHIPKGEPVQVISSDGDWCNVTYGSDTGYVKQEYLSEEKPQ